MSKKLKSEKGHSLTEFAGAFVLSALLIAGCLGSANIVMPVLYQLMVAQNEQSFSEDEPAAPAP
jgi:hypothetical protein